jgi:hypothetical protein
MKICHNCGVGVLIGTLLESSHMKDGEGDGRITLKMDVRQIDFENRRWVELVKYSGQWYNSILAVHNLRFLLTDSSLNSNY